MTEIDSTRTRQTNGAMSAAEESLFRALSLLPSDEITRIQEIARFVTGADDASAVRATYHQLEHSALYPGFKRSGRWVLRPSSVEAKKWAQELRAFSDVNQQTLTLLHSLLSRALSLYADAACGRCNPQQLAQLALVSSEAAG